MSVKQSFSRWLTHFLGGVQEPWYTLLNALANRWLLFKNPERVTCRGDLNEGKTIYLIRELSPHVGLAGWYDRVLGYVLRARKMGWVPVVVPPDGTDPERGD